MHLVENCSSSEGARLRAASLTAFFTAFVASESSFWAVGLVTKVWTRRGILTLLHPSSTHAREVDKRFGGVWKQEVTQGGRCCFLPLRNKHGEGSRSGDLKSGREVGGGGLKKADGDSFWLWREAELSEDTSRMVKKKECGRRRKDVSGSTGSVR